MGLTTGGDMFLSTIRLVGTGCRLKVSIMCMLYNIIQPVLTKSSHAMEYNPLKLLFFFFFL
jgi:hypothetical protein